MPSLAPKIGSLNKALCHHFSEYMLKGIVSHEPLDTHTNYDAPPDKDFMQADSASLAVSAPVRRKSNGGRSRQGSGALPAGSSLSVEAQVGLFESAANAKSPDTTAALVAALQQAQSVLSDANPARSSSIVSAPTGMSLETINCILLFTG
jgi:hypothetical protein